MAGKDSTPELHPQLFPSLKFETVSLSHPAGLDPSSVLGLSQATQRPQGKAGCAPQHMSFWGSGLSQLKEYTVLWAGRLGLQ